MLKLAAKMLRHRLGSATATLIALAVGVVILTAMGGVVESGLRHQPEARRYAAADAVIAHRTMTVTGRDFDGSTVRSTVDLPEGGTVPADLAGRAARIPGVSAAVADLTVPVTLPGGPAVGRGWSSAALTPFRIVAGAAPRGDDEIVVEGRLGAVGARTAVLVDGVAQPFRISGVAERAAPADEPPAIFFTDARAAELGTHPGRADAVGILLADDADRDGALAAVRRLADEAGATAYAGADLGRAEQVGAAAAAGSLLVLIGTSFGGYVALLIVFVVAGTVGLSVRHRRRDLALLRAVAATPGQIRRMIVTEAALISLVAAAVGLPAGVAATGWVRGEMVARGLVPDDFPIRVGPLAATAAVLLIVAAAVLAALIAARRTARIRPVEALGESAVEPGRNGKVRLGFGLAALAGAGSLTGFTTAADGQAAVGAAVGLLYLFVLAVALLAPWINRAAARVAAPVLRAAWRQSGYLAARNLQANARGMTTVLTALVLSVGFGGSVWFLQDNLQRQTVTQTRDGMLADRVLTAPAGLPQSAAEAARRLPGVAAATGVRETSVLVRFLDAVEPVTAQGVDPAGLAETVDLKVTDGSLADLGPTGVAVSAVQAATNGWRVGEQVDLWLGDGTPAELRVVALYDRGLGFGDVVLDRATLAGHTATTLDDRVLVRAEPGAAIDADLAALAARHPGSTVLDARDLTGAPALDLALSAWLNKLLIGVMVGYAALAAANTMVMAALARRRELSLLRLVGVTRRQVKRMMHAEQVGLLGTSLLIGAAIAGITLSSVVNALTGDPVPYVPLLGFVVVIGGATLLALATTVLPIGRLLRIPPVESIGIRE